MSVAQFFSVSDLGSYNFDSQYRVYLPSGSALRPAEADSPLLTLLRNCADVSSSSAEVVRRGIEHGFRYETDPNRIGVLAGLTLPKGARVLEIGGTGGALARYLGEAGCEVTALHPTVQGAACIAERCRGLDRVSVVVSSVESFHTLERFDVVVSVDPELREGAHLDPIGQLARRAKELLKPTGTFILGVANVPLTLDEHIVVHTRDHVRGVMLPSSSVAAALTQIGFRHIETLAAYPHHASPALLVHTDIAQRSRTEWQRDAIDTFDSQLSILPKVLTALKKNTVTYNSVYELDDIAPGTVFLAHGHRVHALLWNGEGAVKFPLSGTEDRLECAHGSDRSGVTTRVLPFADPNVASWMHREGRPRLISIASPDAEVQTVRRELARALARERELYAGLAREEVKLKVEHEELQALALQLHDELATSAARIEDLSEKVKLLSTLLEEEQRRSDGLVGELQGVRVQHRAFFREMNRFKEGAEAALLRVQELHQSLEIAKQRLKNTEEAAREVRLSEQRLRKQVDNLESYTFSLEGVVERLDRRSAALDAELKAWRKTYGWRMASMIQRFVSWAKK